MLKGIICYHAIDSALVTDYVPNEESRQALSRYLSHFALTDEDDLVLRQPEMDIPEGFHLIHNRCSKRCLYEMSPGFAVILSEESSWNSNKRTEESRKTVCKSFRLFKKFRPPIFRDFCPLFLSTGSPRSGE